jgi:hypothetical protein
VWIPSCLYRFAVRLAVARVLPGRREWLRTIHSFDPCLERIQARRKVLRLVGIVVVVDDDDDDDDGVAKVHTGAAMASIVDVCGACVTTLVDGRCC